MALLGESGQWLEIVDQVLARGKLLLQKTLFYNT